MLSLGGAVIWPPATRRDLQCRSAIFDIKDEVDTDALMITWRFCTSPHIVKGVIFINLVHFSTNGKLPKVMIVVLIDSECMISISWKENTKLEGGSSSLRMQLGLFTHPSKLDSVRSNALQRLPSWFIKKVIVFCILGKSDRTFVCHDRERLKGFRAIFPLDKDIVGGSLVPPVR
jgi:hypothetical protein